MFLVGSKQSYAQAAIILNTNPKNVERNILKMCEKKSDVSLRYAKVKRLGIDQKVIEKVKKIIFAY